MPFEPRQTISEALNNAPSAPPPLAPDPSARDAITRAPVLRATTRNLSLSLSSRAGWLQVALETPLI